MGKNSCRPEETKVAERKMLYRRAGHKEERPLFTRGPREVWGGFAFGAHSRPGNRSSGCRRPCSGGKDVQGTRGRTPGGGGVGSVGSTGPGAPGHAVRPPAGAEGRLGSGGRPRPRGHLGGPADKQRDQCGGPGLRTPGLAPASAAVKTSMALAELRFTREPQERRQRRGGSAGAESPAFLLPFLIPAAVLTKRTMDPQRLKGPGPAGGA